MESTEETMEDAADVKDPVEKPEVNQVSTSVLKVKALNGKKSPATVSTSPEKPYDSNSVDDEKEETESRRTPIACIPEETN